MSEAVAIQRIHLQIFRREECKKKGKKRRSHSHDREKGRGKRTPLKTKARRRWGDGCSFPFRSRADWGKKNDFASHT